MERNSLPYSSTNIKVLVTAMFEILFRTSQPKTNLSPAATFREGFPPTLVWSRIRNVSALNLGERDFARGGRFFLSDSVSLRVAGGLRPHVL